MRLVKQAYPMVCRINSLLARSEMQPFWAWSKICTKVNLSRLPEPRVSR